MISSLFVITYVFLDYRIYLTEFYARQSQEITEAQQKTEVTLNHLGKLLSLIESRIENTHGDSKRIQRVLNSVHQGVQGLPELQKIIFYKLSPPRTIITRFGELPFDTHMLPKEENLPKNRSPLFKVENQNVMGRTVVRETDQLGEGVLEIQVSLAEFWDHLGTYQTIGFSYLSDAPYQKAPSLFHIQKKAHQTFWAYGLAHQSKYLGLGCYMLFSIILLGLCLYSLSTYFQRRFGRKASRFERALHASQSLERASREELWVYQQDAQNHQTSCHLSRKLQEDIKLKHREYLGHLVQSLEILKKSFTAPMTALSGADQVELINLCLRQARPLSVGLWEPGNKDEVDLGIVIRNIPFLFAEKICASDISILINIDTQEPLFLQTEAVLMDMLLINVIGRLIYRVPKGGKVEIFLREKNGRFFLEIQDNGYYLKGTSANLVKNSSDFFMEDDIFLQACQENGITYNTSKGKNGGMNVTHLTLSASRESIANSNVVPLFR